MHDLTPGITKVRKRLVSLDIGQHHAFEIFTAKKKVFLEISKVLLNDIFAKFDGGSQIKNIITDKLNLGELRVEQKLRQKVRRNVYQSDKTVF